MKLFLYPHVPEGLLINPYPNNFEKALSSYFIIYKKKYGIRLPQFLLLLLNSFSADVYVLNWIEGVGQRRYGSIRALVVMLAMSIIRLRRKKIIWMLHNIHPHNGEEFWSQKIQGYLFRNSSIIISHSEEAEKYGKEHASCPVYFRKHPVTLTKYGEWKEDIHNCDFFIWGQVLPYKGVAEFISNPLCEKLAPKILIVGSCKDTKLIKSIKMNLSKNIIFENRHADYDEIAAQCKKAKYVLFPYIGDSISSSGVLMDTLQMGGTPLGPNRGAFADLAKEGCCLTYDNINEVFSLLNKPKQDLSSKAVDIFLQSNSWDEFAKWVFNLINEN